MSISKLKSVIDLFNHGQVVANPEAWKKGQVTTNVVVGFIWSILSTATAYGYAIPVEVDKDIVDGIAVSVLAVANLACTVISSDKIGIKKK